MLVQQLVLQYSNQQLPHAGPPGAASFADYVAFAQQQDKQAALQYWKTYLTGVKPCHFPRLLDEDPRSDGHATMSSVLLEVEAAPLQGFCKTNGVTIPTLMQAAWATVLRTYTQTEDVCFGYLASGRDEPAIIGVQDMIGSLIHLLVCRVRFEDEQNHSFIGLLQRLQGELGPALQNQYSSLAEIQNSLGDVAIGGSFFNTLVSMIYSQTPLGQPNTESSIMLDKITTVATSEYDVTLSIDFSPWSKNIAISFIYQNSVMSPAAATALSGSFAQILQLITKSTSSAPQEADVISAFDLERIRKEQQQSVLLPPNPFPDISTNGITSAAAETCVHMLIAEQVRVRPSDQAIASWDNNLTYAEFHALAIRLASVLQRELGVGPEVLVPLCFPKSTYAVVAMVAVLMAGGAFVPLDPKAPAARLQGILKDTRATVVLTAPGSFEATIRNMDTAQRLSVLAINEEMLSTLPAPSSAGTRSEARRTGTAGGHPFG
ncbi:uncharacterized protein PgNI_08007 [Pyricularia grisea]|uniref:AMP-dependent synthetase/ligase domain-containing protein n=1 Tax=Pyricularia grisea TaxID=148305 RepID=A0A6P8AWV5_PYRGI|nr:uncharacterized protein PgNI_08007 [Pyricularia grisea]TLD06703.1 hypothetical protein PgNI_08007 [Pyricularia grisea]